MSWDILPKANLQYFLSKLKDKLDLKVDAVSGKGLSTNDYTTAEKTKLAGIEAGAQVNDSGTQTVTGNPIAITNAAPINAEGLSITLTPKQSGSGTPSPSNIRPIVGFDTADVRTCTINQWDEEWERGQYRTGNGTKTNGTSNLTTIRCKNFIPVFPGTTYYFYNGSGKTRRVFYYDINKKLIDSVSSPTEFTVPSNCYYITFHMQSGDSGYGTTYNHDISINYPATDTSYHAYSGNKVSVQIGNRNMLPLTVNNLKEFNTSGTWVDNTYSYHDLSFVALVDENNLVTGIKVKGTANANTEFRLSNQSGYGSNVYKGATLNGCTSGSSDTYALLATYSSDGSAWAAESYQTDDDLTISASYDYMKLAIYIKSGTVLTNYVYYPMIRSANDGDFIFSPYNPALGSYVYGGTVDINSGKYTITDANIASYNGETLPSTWISDRDEYTSGRTPTTGAQVVYKLATPITLYFEHKQLAMLQGLNNVASNGIVVLEYQPDNVISEGKAESQSVNEKYDELLSNTNNISQNVLPLSLDGIKSSNTSGTWNGNKYTRNNVVFEVFTSKSGLVSEIVASGTASSNATFTLYMTQTQSFPYNGYLLSGCVGGSSSTYDLRISDTSGGAVACYDGDKEISLDETGKWVASVLVRSGVTVKNQIFRPMLRNPNLKNKAFQEYIPSNAELWAMIKALQG